MTERLIKLIETLKITNPNMLSRKTLLDLGFSMDDIENAKQQNVVSVLGDGNFASVLLIAEL